MDKEKQLSIDYKGAAMTIPEYLYKIISKEQWEKSLVQKQIVASPIDDHFIHLAKEEQIDRVIEKFWKDEDYIILKLSTKKLGGRLILETNPGGSTKFYHLYDGNISLEAVQETIKRTFPKTYD